MATTLFNRAVKLTIAPPVAGSFRTVKTQSAMVVTGLRVEFKITKTLTKEPNTSTVTVYNLNATSRAALQGKGSRVWLEAGYGTALGQIFAGDVTLAEHRREGPNWISKFELADGGRAYAHGRVNVSFKAGTKRADLLKQLVAQSGWDLGNVAQFAADLQQQVCQGYCCHGPAWAAIDKALSAQGLTWSIQDGAIQILPLVGYMPQVAVVLDEDHGLIGSPEFGSPAKKGQARTIKCKSLLQATLVPGRRVRLTSAAHTGTLVAQKVDHSGDTDGNDWYSDCEATPV